MSEVSDLAFVIDDGVLSEAWTIRRSTGVFTIGGWVTTPTLVSAWGVVSVATEQDLEMLPEADRITGSMVFHTQTRIYETQVDQPGYGEGAVGIVTQRVSDIMIWNYQQYRVLHVGPYPNRNYWKAIAARMQGA